MCKLAPCFSMKVLPQIVANTPVLGKAALIVLPQWVALTCQAEVGCVSLTMIGCSGSHLFRKRGRWRFLPPVVEFRHCEDLLAAPTVSVFGKGHIQTLVCWF